MSKVLKVAAIVVGAVALAVTGIGLALGTSVALFGTLSATTLGYISIGLSVGAQLLGKKPKQAPSETLNRLTATFDLQATRKMVFGGPTAMATDVRYQGYSGSAQDYLNWIVAVAAHEVEEISEVWFDSEQAWSATGGIASKYSGYLTITARNPGSAGNAIVIDGAWNGAARLTGCAYLYVRFKLTGNTSKTESPFAQSVPTRMTVIGKGMKVYDPRLDSTNGGSGPQRPDDQTTWTFGSGGRNPALQVLTYLLGWRINGKVSVGRGIPPSRLDLDAFITAANLCDESVTLAAGGTEPRYRADGVFSEADSPETVLGALNAAMNAVLRDANGRLALHVIHNDLATPVAAFSEADIIGDEGWRQTVALSDSFNTVRGRYIDPSPNSLFQPVDYPEVSLDSVDDIDRVDTLDLLVVQSASQAQRLAKQRLQRAQYQGTYTATLNARAWQLSLGDVATLSHAYLGWADKLFRVISMGITVDGKVPVTLLEEHPDIYAWDAEESPAVQAADPETYNPLLHPFVQAFDNSGALPGQLLWDDTFASTYWVVPSPAVRVNWGSSRAEWAVNIPFAESTDVRVYYDTALDRLPRTFPGKPLWVRVTAQPEGVEPEGLTLDGEPLELDGEPLTIGAPAPADFPLEVAIDWLDTNGDFVSRTVIATLDPDDGEQTVVASATASEWGLARPSVGYTSQSGKVGTWAVYEPWMAEYEPTADNTADAVPVMTIPSPLKLNAAADGTITSTLPATIKAVRQRGGVDVSPLATWAAVFPSGITGSINNTPGSASRGLITITAVTTSAGGRITVSSDREGVPLVGFLDVQVDQAAPSTGGTSGGGTSATTSMISQATSTSYGPINGGPLTVNAGSAGRIDLSTSLNFSGDTYEEYYDCAGKWQWRVPAGVWADVAAEVPDSSPAWAGEVGHWYGAETESYPGGIFVNQAKTGLTPGSPYEVRLLLRKTAGSGNINFFGNASAIGS